LENIDRASYMENQLTVTERQMLLELARQALEAVVRGQAMPTLDLAGLSPRLRQAGASFVTLTRRGELRGCVGALEAYQPLAEDVREHASAAALQDYRFPPVQPYELSAIEIEISCLTAPRELEYAQPADLPGVLHPHRDGVTLFDGRRRATFLPQVWEKLPDPEDFLGHLCQKMGDSPDLWRRRKLRVQTYQVEEFSE
jgi:AmmeMemoRadiSam system protein A